MSGVDSRVTIRPARPTDLPELRAIQASTLSEPAPTLLTAAVEGAGLALTAVLDQACGYILALTADGSAYVPELAVAHSCQRRGIGTKLLEAVGQRANANGADQLRLTVRLEDDGARAFYREQGFDVIARLPDHFESGSGTGLLFARRL